MKTGLNNQDHGRWHKCFKATPLTHGKAAGRICLKLPHDMTIIWSRRPVNGMTTKHQQGTSNDRSSRPMHLH